MKYGALSARDGKVDLAWTKTAKNGKMELDLTWKESGGPNVSKPATTGFGSYLLEKGLPDAEVNRDFRADGLTCTIRCPLD